MRTTGGIIQHVWQNDDWVSQELHVDLEVQFHRSRLIKILRSPNNIWQQRANRRSRRRSKKPKYA